MNATRPATIHVLAPEVASKIAAGEVIERPASVVRELLDNAIDAGASHVRVEIVGGGRELIRVVDDGCGMAREDIPRAFLRHATSKIRTAEDLSAIRTLGFRGEALFSIAAVSKVHLLSRSAESYAGYEVYVEGGHIVAQGPKGAGRGTAVTVRDLFYNLPARLKFLRSRQTEAAYITALLQQYAMAHPAVRFSLINEGRLTFQSPGDGDLRAAASCVYGAEVASSLLPVGLEPDGATPDDGGLNVYGYVSPPATSRSNRQAMHFFVNRRAVQSRMLQFAVEEAYHSLLMVGRHPICIIHVTIDPELVDVNVHPAKAEVKFRDERAVFSAVQKAVRAALAAHMPPPVYGTRGAHGWQLPEAPAGLGLEAEFSAWSPAPGMPPAQSGQSEMWPRSAPAGLEGTQEQGVAPSPLPPPPPRSLPPLRVVGQVAGTYIIAEGPDGLFLIDQHAAHERILYEQLEAALAAGGMQIQPLLQPVPLELTASQRAHIEPVLPVMAEMGFEIEPFGDTALLVRAVPAVYAASRRDLSRDLLEILDEVVHGSHPERWRADMLISLACHSAIRAGQSLSVDEMRAMLGQLELCRFPRSCAHGRPTMLHLSQMQLEREFGRRA